MLPQFQFNMNTYELENTLLGLWVLEVTPYIIARKRCAVPCTDVDLIKMINKTKYKTLIYILLIEDGA